MFFLKRFKKYILDVYNKNKNSIIYFSVYFLCIILISMVNILFFNNNFNYYFTILIFIGIMSLSEKDQINNLVDNYVKNEDYINLLNKRLERVNNYLFFKLIFLFFYFLIIEIFIEKNIFVNLFLINFVGSYIIISFVIKLFNLQILREELLKKIIK